MLCKWPIGFGKLSMSACGCWISIRVFAYVFDKFDVRALQVAVSVLLLFAVNTHLPGMDSQLFFLLGTRTAPGSSSGTSPQKTSFL